MDKDLQITEIPWYVGVMGLSHLERNDNCIAFLHILESVNNFVPWICFSMRRVCYFSYDDPPMKLV